MRVATYGEGRLKPETWKSKKAERNKRIEEGNGKVREHFQG